MLEQVLQADRLATHQECIPNLQLMIHLALVIILIEVLTVVISNQAKRSLQVWTCLLNRTS